MLNPNELEAVPEKTVQIFRQLQLDVMEDIIQRVSVNRDISRTADWEISRLYELGVSKRFIKKRIKDALNLTTREINRIYRDVIWADYARYEPIYRTKGRPWIPFEKNKQLQQLIGGVKEQTNAEFKNITQSLGFALKKPDGTRVFQSVAKAYQTTFDKAAFGMLSGVYDYNTMIKRAVKELTDSGLRTVDYETGWSNRVEVAARRALMTGFNQVVAKITEDNAEKLGTEHFEVTYHRGARPTHQPWQGRVYTKEQLVTVCGYGAVDGLKGANCYHDFHPFFPGISKRIYSDEELDRMNEEENTPKEYGGKQYTVYEALQRQRRMESSLRKRREEIALLEQGGADADDILAKKAKYHGLSSEYAQFSKAMNLPQQRERISVDGRKGVDTSFGKPTEFESKTVAKSGESGIIREKSKKPITIITDNAIKSVPKVEVSGYTAEQCAKIQEQHKELLKYARDKNDSKEVAFVFDSLLENRKEYIGSDDIIDFGNSLQGNGLVILHNHPKNSSYSFNDIVEFIGNDRIKTFTIVKNNGKVETLTKLNSYDTLDMLRKLQRISNDIKKSALEGDYRDSLYRKAIDKFLKKYQTGGIIEWMK